MNNNDGPNIGLIINFVLVLIAIVPLLKYCDSISTVSKISKIENIEDSINTINKTKYADNFYDIEKSEPILKKELIKAVDVADNTDSLQGESIVKIPLDNINDFNKIDEDWFDTINNPRIISLFPTNNSQYKKMYKKPASIKSENEIEKINNKINNTKNSSIVFDHDDFIKNISNNKGNPIVIMSHSIKNGKTAIFPNGNKMNITEIHEQCIELQKRCLVLTCYGDDFDIQEKISAFDALKMWDETMNIDGILNTNEFIHNMRKSRIKQKRRKKIIVSWVVVSTTGSGVVINVSTQNDSEK